MKTLGILQARLSSSRLPEKVLRPLLGRPMLLQQIDRIKRSRKLDHLVVATSTDPSDSKIQQLCQTQSIECSRGSLEDVLDRFYNAARSHTPEWIVRLTGDCPLIDPEVIDQLVGIALTSEYDYVSNTLTPTFPDGLDCEVFRYSALEDAWKNAKLNSEREHVTPYIKKNSRLKKFNLSYTIDLSAHRWTVDEPEDFEFVKRVYEGIFPKNPHFGMKDILEYLSHHKELLALNQHHIRDAGYLKSLERDKSK